MQSSVVFKFQIWNVGKGDAHRCRAFAALCFHCVRVVKHPIAVLFIDRVHGALELYAPRLILFSKKRWRVIGSSYQSG